MLSELRGVTLVILIYWGLSGERWKLFCLNKIQIWLINQDVHGAENHEIQKTFS